MRAIRWQLQFKSYCNDSCRIDIYDENWEGGITQLVGTSDPLTYDENGDIAFDTFIHTKTGYLNVIEQSYGELDSLYPDNDRQHYVEAYHGEECEFCGYMQAINMSQQYTAAPRSLQFPVLSALQLCEAVNFPRFFDTTKVSTIASLLKVVIDELKANYTEIIFPQIGENDYPMNFTIPSTFFYNINKGYKPSLATVEIPDEEAYTVKSLRTFFEAVCKYFGWSLHEYGHTLYFVKTDNSTKTKYRKITYEHLTDCITTYVGEYDYMDLEDMTQIELCSDRSTIEKTRAPKSVKVTIESQTNTTKSLLDGKLWTGGAAGNNSKGSGWENRNPLITYSSEGVASFLDIEENFQNIPGVYPITYAAPHENTRAAGEEMLMIKWNTYYDNQERVIASWTLDSLLSKSRAYILRMSVRTGSSMNALEDRVQYGSLSFKIMLNAYIDGNIYTYSFQYGAFVAGEHNDYKKLLTINRDTGRLDKINDSTLTNLMSDDGFIFNPMFNLQFKDAVFVLTLFSSGQSSGGSNTLVQIQEFSLSPVSSWVFDYEQPQNEYTVLGNGTENETYSLPLTSNKDCDYRIGFPSDYQPTERVIGCNYLVPPGTLGSHYYIEQTFRVKRQNWDFGFLYPTTITGWKGLRYHVHSIRRSMYDDELIIKIKSI